MSNLIEVNRSSWHASLYLWWYYAKWPHKKDAGEKVVGNLCPYVRTVLLWAPLRWVFYQGRVGSLHIAYITWPVFLLSIPQPLGYLSYMLKRILWSLDACLAGVLLIVGIVYVINLIAVWADDKWNWSDKLYRIRLERKRRKNIRWELEYEKRKVKSTGPSFWKLIGERISAAHDRVCPEILFK